MNQKIDGRKRKDAKCEEHSCWEEVGVMEGEERWKGEKWSSRSGVACEGGREGLIELDKNQDG